MQDTGHGEDDTDIQDTEADIYYSDTSCDHINGVFTYDHMSWLCLIGSWCIALNCSQYKIPFVLCVYRY